MNRIIFSSSITAAATLCALLSLCSTSSMHSQRIQPTETKNDTATAAIQQNKPQQPPVESEVRALAKTDRAVLLPGRLRAGDEKRKCESISISGGAMACPKSVVAMGCFVPAQQPTADFNTEGYDRIYENRMVKVLDNPLSTFSIDVDVASYSNVRRFITGNQLPPKDAVRIEEMINYFTYDYVQPEVGQPFSIATELGACPWNSAHRLVLIGIQGKKIPVASLPPSNLVFLIDVSGSMESPDKLPLLKMAMKMLVGTLRPEDKISIVVYAGAAGQVLGATPGSNKEKIIQAIEQLSAGGSTAGGAGIMLAYATAKENFLKEGNNRVILATDGDFNIGMSSDGEMERLIETKRNDGIFLTVLGFGTGNYKDSKMEKLADKGNGNYAYIDNLMEAKKVLVSQMGGTLFAIAKDVKIQVEFNPAQAQAYRLIGYENRMLAKEDFNNDAKDAGELGSGHSVTALYEIVPYGVAFDVPAVDELKYQKTTRVETTGNSPELLTVKLRYKEPTASKSMLISKTLDNRDSEKMPGNLGFAASIAGFGMLLRESEYANGLTYNKVLDLAKAGRGKDNEGYRSELIRLIELAALLAHQNG